MALGYSMIIDYKTNKMTFGKHLPEEPTDFELSMRDAPAGDGARHRDGSHPRTSSSTPAGR